MNLANLAAPYPQNHMKENKKTIIHPSYSQFLDEHWKQFKLACQSMNFGDTLDELHWREYVLWDLCNRHNKEIDKNYFMFDEPNE